MHRVPVAAVRNTRNAVAIKLGEINKMASIQNTDVIGERAEINNVAIGIIKSPGVIFMAKEKLLTNTQLKSVLKDFKNDELIKLITDISQACPQAKEFLTVKFTGIENAHGVLGKYKQKIEHEFYPKRGFGRLNLREAKKAITDFKKICSNKEMVIDIMLFYVENCVEFTAEYGDINESFYNSAISVYGQVVKEINSGDIGLFGVFAERLKSAADNACEGWGFYDEMIDLYYQIDWVEDNEA